MLIVNYMLSYVNSIRQNLWKLCRSCFALREAVQLLEILLRILEKNQNILKFAKTVIFIEYYYYSSGRCSVLPPPRLGGVGILVFFWGGGCQSIFDISGGLAYEEFIFLLGRSVHCASIFLFWNARFGNIKNFHLWRPHFQYSHFQI